ncbi:MAG TPA: carbon-nitrogen hydrolase family protein [Alphaproteobacteria bacterium]|nr:carbon-nitrogen hydrolase family protein [Alphaproteobacteria bacterium]
MKGSPKGARVKVACIQTNSGPDILPNIEEVERMARSARAAGAELITTPEVFTSVESTDARRLEKALPESKHPAIPRFTALAKELGCWFVMGSLTIKLAPAKVNNRSYLIDPSGRIVARYNKLHLFDVELKEGEQYKESATVEPGDRAVLAPTPWGPIGLTVCYDLRFPQLYRALAQAGAVMLSIPSAFTKTTGKAHWHVLLRARAIETGAYVLAPAQCGQHAGGRKTYGHSLIVDPWGEVVVDGGEAPGYVLAELDMDKVATARRMIPSLEHDRPFSGPGPARRIAQAGE